MTVNNFIIEATFVAGIGYSPASGSGASLHKSYNASNGILTFGFSGQITGFALKGTNFNIYIIR